ncbi:MAG: hypothetical protein JO090_11425 [Rhizobacter sp.]|nr:hypothetical protein [Rhizobacter sp.]
MRIACSLIATCTLVAATFAVSAAPGDIVVPAHRTKDGQWVPANVPPTSGATHLARTPSRGHAAPARQSASAPAAHLLPPLLVEAQPIRR